jgi:hypothetical protein
MTVRGRQGGQETLESKALGQTQAHVNQAAARWNALLMSPSMYGSPRVLKQKIPYAQSENLPLS